MACGGRGGGVFSFLFFPESVYILTRWGSGQCGKVNLPASTCCYGPLAAYILPEVLLL